VIQLGGGTVTDTTDSATDAETTKTYALSVTWDNIKSVAIGSTTYTKTDTLPTSVDVNTKIVVISKNNKTATIVGPDSSNVTDEEGTNQVAELDDDNQPTGNYNSVPFHTYTFDMPSKEVTIS
jgi:hypothetical protein